MYKYIIIIGFILISSNYIKAQLTLESSLSTGINMTIAQKEIHPESSLWNFTLAKDFAGINVGANLGVRLFLLKKQCSIGGSIGYLFRYHEAGNGRINTTIKNTKHPEHFVTIPLDIGYHLKSGLGFHLGLEGSWIITPYQSNQYLQIRKTVIISPFVGLSYTYKRFRFDLFYKHSINNLFVSKYPNYISASVGIHIDKILYRHHDIELRVVFRIFEFKKI
jgi:hypothetical protein